MSSHVENAKKPPDLTHRIKIGLREQARRHRPQWMLYGVILILIVSAATQSATFRTRRNSTNVLRQTALPGTVSIGQTFVIISGGIDLSVGSTVKLTSLVAAIINDGREDRVALAVAAALLVGFTIGLCNALLIVRMRIPPIIATLGTFTILRGLAFTISTHPTGQASASVQDFYDPLTGGTMPPILLVLAVLWTGGYFLLRGTVVGRHIYAIGGNEQAALLSGIKINRMRIFVYCLSGVLASIGGIVAVMRTGLGDPIVGNGLELDSITAVVLGGTSLYGGQGTMIGTLGGVLLLGLINNIFNVTQISQWYQQLIKGIIIVGAVALYKQRS